MRISALASTLLLLAACAARRPAAPPAARPSLLDCSGSGQGVEAGTLYTCLSAKIMMVHWDLRAAPAEALEMTYARLSASFRDLGAAEHRLAAPGALARRIGSRADGPAAPDEPYEGLLVAREMMPGVSRVVLCGALGERRPAADCEPLVDDLLADPPLPLGRVFRQAPVAVAGRPIAAPAGCRGDAYPDGTAAIICGLDRVEITSFRAAPPGAADEMRAYLAAPRQAEGTPYEFTTEPIQCSILETPASVCVKAIRTQAPAFLADRGVMALATIGGEDWFVNCLYAGPAVPAVCRQVLSGI